MFWPTWTWRTCSYTEYHQWQKLKDAKKISSRTEYQNVNHNAIKTSIQSWNSTEKRLSCFQGTHFTVGKGNHPISGGSGPQVNPNARTHSHVKREEQENGAVVLLDSPARNQTCSLIKLKASFIFSWRVWFKERFFSYMKGSCKEEEHCGEFGLLPALLVSKVKWIPKPEVLKRDL